jgi:3-methylfumaryl-CoA hydratase
VSDPALAAAVGREERCADVLGPWPAAALAAALDRDDAPAVGEPLPPFWHHLYAHGVVRGDATGPDGHARRGDFLPDAPGRRMWAGGRVVWHRPLRLGEPVERVSTVRAVTEKAGRSGPLVLVTVEHRWTRAGGLALVEEQDVVYRAGAAAAPPPPAPTGAVWRCERVPDPVLLFRYSALTWNGHRIHYDADHAREVEGYRGLVVHGPLLVTLMLELLRRERPCASLRRLAFRGVSPAIAAEPLEIGGAPAGEARALLWVATAHGLCMSAEAELA